MLSPTTIKNNCKKGRATKTRLLTDPVSLFVSNFKISVLGRIGCKKFSASAHLVDTDKNGVPKEYDAYNLANLTGGNNQNIYAKINLPNNLISSSIYMEFNHSISIDCISANDVFHESDYGVFTATLEGTLDMKTTFTPIVEEKLVVFTAPNGLECN